MLNVFARIGEVLGSDGDIKQLRATRRGALVNQDFGGRFDEMVERGMAFMYDFGTAFVMGAAGAANLPIIANWQGSNTKLVIYKILANVQAPAAAAVGGLAFNALTPCGAQIGTAGPIPTATIGGTKTNCALGSEQVKATNPKVQILTTATYTTNPSIVSAAGVGIHMIATPANLSQVVQIEVNVNGLIQVYPGCAFGLCGRAAISTATWNVSVLLAEVPLRDNA